MSSERERRLLDRVEIREVLSSYARGVDRADEALLKSCYHDDAIEEHAGNFTGNAHEYVEGAVGRIREMGVMQHLLGSSHIEFDGDRAWVETYVWTFLRIERDGVSTDTLTGGRLHDRFERRNERWKIAHRKTILDWNRDAPTQEGWCLGLINFDNPGALQGSTDRSDPSYERF